MRFGIPLAREALDGIARFADEYFEKSAATG